MLDPGDLWRHVTINTHSSWLPGDPRGFRSHGHTTHSSGDYKKPPPVGEHVRLHQHARQISAPVVTVDHTLRRRVAESLRDKFIALDRNVLSVAVGGQHAHVVVLLWENPRASKLAVGQAKQRASHAVRHELPGQVWADGAQLKPIVAPSHLREAVKYDRDHANEGAYVWLSDEAMAMIEGRLDPATLM